LIVGVMADTQYEDLRRAAPPFVIAPSTQFPDPHPGTMMMIHSSLPPIAIAESVKRMFGERHPEMVVQADIFQSKIRDGLMPERLMAMLSGVFGLMAALLGMLGLYGVISYIVTQRRNEIGIRIALGARTGQVIAMVMREATLLILVGVIVGIAMSLIAGRTAESLLFGVKSNDFVTLLTSAGFLALIGLIASVLPARRASKLDPTTALRCD
jgi:ABC-type antimicrobial peptide transport system permease subunit